jgi:hypothetical protein
VTENPLPSWATKGASAGQPNADSFFAEFIGPKWEKTYRKKFRPFFAEPSFQPTWNWSAALFPLWFLYRKLYFPFILFWLAPGFVRYLMTGGESSPAAAAITAQSERDLLLTFGAVLTVAVLSGGTANWLLWRRAVAALRVTQQQPMAPEERSMLVRRIGGVNRRGVWVMLVLTAVLTGVALLQAGL